MGRKPITAKVDEALVERVDAECAKRNVHRSDAVAEGLVLWLRTPRAAVPRVPGKTPTMRSPHDEVTPRLKGMADPQQREPKPPYAKGRGRR